MAQTLDDQVYQAQPPSISYTAAPASAPLLHQQQQAWSPWAQQPQQQYTQPSQQELAQSLANLSMTSIPWAEFGSVAVRTIEKDGKTKKCCQILL